MNIPPLSCCRDNKTHQHSSLWRCLCDCHFRESCLWCSFQAECWMEYFFSTCVHSGCVRRQRGWVVLVGKPGIPSAASGHVLLPVNMDNSGLMAVMHKGQDLSHCMLWEVQFKAFLRHLEIKFLGVSASELFHMQNSHWLNRACCTQISGGRFLFCCIFPRDVKETEVNHSYCYDRQVVACMCGRDSLWGVHLWAVWMPNHWKNKPIKKKGQEFSFLQSLEEGLKKNLLF